MSEILLSGERIAARVAPESGGALVSLRSRRSGKEFLLPSSKLSATVYGMDFARTDRGGFDECFPTVAPAAFKRRGRTTDWPDHGELWSRPWAYRTNGDALHLWIEGEALPYRFEKCLRLTRDGLEIRYTLSHAEIAFPYLWAAHPLLHLVGGERIRLPPEVDRVRVTWATRSSFVEAGSSLPWPTLGVAGADYSRVPVSPDGRAVKAFTPRLRNGWAEVHYPDSGERLRFEFDPAQTGYLGLWFCYGGWPQDGEPQYTLALEPTTTAADAPSDHPVLRPGETHEWGLSLHILP